MNISNELHQQPSTSHQDSDTVATDSMVSIPTYINTLYMLAYGQRKHYNTSNNFSSNICTRSSLIIPAPRLPLQANSHASNGESLRNVTRLAIVVPSISLMRMCLPEEAQSFQRYNCRQHAARPRLKSRRSVLMHAMLSCLAMPLPPLGIPSHGLPWE
jgi:hypothetical protein